MRVGGEKRVGVLALLVDVDGEDFEPAVPVMLIERVERRKRGLARQTPAGPEVDQHDVPFVVGRVHDGPIRQMHRHRGYLGRRERSRAEREHQAGYRRGLGDSIERGHGVLAHLGFNGTRMPAEKIPASNPLLAR